MRSWPLLLCALVSRAAASCQLITVDLCRGSGYNHTSMPNLVGHDSQADADFTLQTFSPLVQYGCSAQLSFFLCSVYVPMCNEKVATPIGPCRGLCEAVRSRCYPVLQGFGFPWPAALDCAKFPAQNDHRQMCMEGPGELGPVRRVVPPESEGSLCSRYARPGMYVRANRTGRCVQLCEADVLFTSADKDVAELWITALSAACFVSALFSVLTFLMDSGCPYPERPLAFLALCYGMVSVGWGVRAVMGRDAVACYPDLTRTLLLAQEGLGNAHCALVFFLTYYFGNAIAIWWVVQTLCWGWTQARSLALAPVFHLVSWGLPACLTIAALVLRSVDADELTGICSVGSHNTSSLLLFVIVPQCACFVLGCATLLLGVITQPQPWGWQRRLLALLYTSSTGLLVAGHCYQYWGHDTWVLAMGPSPSPRTQPHASLWVLLVRSLVTLSAGTAVSVLMCLPKSPQTWRTILCVGDFYKQSTLTTVKAHQSVFYYYQQPRIHRKHRSHRKHKVINGGETFV